MHYPTETVQSLDFMKTLPMTRWSWEFLRRVPEYEDDYLRNANGSLTRTITSSGVEILRLTQPEPEAEKWGLSFFASPNQTALTAPAFWLESVSPHVVCVEAVARKKGDPKSLFSKIFQQETLGVKRIHFTGVDGREQVILQRGDRAFQLRCSGHSLLDDNVDLRFIVEGFGNLDIKFDTIRRLAKFYDSHAVNGKKQAGWTPKALGLRDALIALDIYQMGGSHYNTAVHIYGQIYAETHYVKSNPALKSRMQRLRKRGIELMQGGYLDLMK